MAFTGKPPPNKPTEHAKPQGKLLRPNPYPGTEPKYVPCYDCGRTGRRKDDEDDCNLCSGLGWVAT